MSSTSSEVYPAGTELMYYIKGVHPSFTGTIKPATSVTVITGGNVFVTGGLGAGIIMKYVDWLILAGGKPIRVSTPIPGLPADEPTPIGTTFEWRMGRETYRIAVKTDNGLLQVKSVTDGGGYCHDDNCECVPCWNYRNMSGVKPLKEVLFPNEDSWRASLPKGGFVTVTPSNKQANCEQTPPVTDCDCSPDGFCCNTHLYE